MIQISKFDSSNPESKRRQALARVYNLLIRLVEENEKQTAHPDDFGEKTGKAGDPPAPKEETDDD